MMRIIFFAICFCCSIHITAQNKQDYVWMFGNDQDINQEGVQGLMFDFNEVPFKPQIHTNGLSFDHVNVSHCDKYGNLLMYSNGCAVANAEHEMMMNGDSINAGDFFDIAWFGNCRFGYPGLQDILILDDPAHDNGFYLITKPLEHDPQADPKSFHKFIKYSYIDLNLDNGLGGVTIKNKPFFEGPMLSSYLTAIQHANQKDWWIVQPAQPDNIFYTFLLDEEGFHLIHEPRLGAQDFHDMASASSTARFSPDGKLYAFYNVYDGLILYDFDRETGEFSNYRTFDFVPYEGNRFTSAEFSSNSRFLYLSNVDSLWQVDLWEEDLNDGKVLIDVYDGVLDPNFNGFISSALAPDCKIYIRTTSSSYSMHVINNPNEKGTACNFVQRGIKFTQTTSVDTYPNVPRYRVDEEEKCDPGITSMFGEAVYYRKTLDVFPNPAQSFIDVTIPENQTGHLFFFNLNGQEIKTPIKVNRGGTEKINISAWPSGTYNVEFISDDAQLRHFWSGLVVKL